MREYKKVLKYCKNIFYKKKYDYGNSWKTLEFMSLNDQIIIKIKRIKYNQAKNKIMINDFYNDFISIINYSIFSIIKLDFEFNLFFKTNSNLNILYDNIIFDSLDLLTVKNKNYKNY